MFRVGLGTLKSFQDVIFEPKPEIRLLLVRMERNIEFLDWLSCGFEIGAIRFPTQTGSIRWPSLSLENIFLKAD